jgi:hypothetical protein
MMVIQTADFASWRLKQRTILFAVARPWLARSYNIFGKSFAEPKDISTASLKDLCRFVRHSVNEYVLRK